MSNREPSNTLAKAGERLHSRAVAALRKRGIDPDDVVVKSVRILGSPDGQWMCADCGESFANSMQMWGHNKKHRIGWWTGTHMEEP